MVPPPSTRIVLIFLSESFFNNNLIFTEFFPVTITSTGSLSNRSKFVLVIFCDTAMIVGILFDVCMILDF